MNQASRCLLIFSRDYQREAHLKGLWKARKLFEYSLRNAFKQADYLDDCDTILVSEDCPDFLEPSFRFITQQGGNFDSRLRNAFESAKKLGYQKIVLIPGDVPGIKSRQMELAFSQLENNSLVLGPSQDGGIYLIGCNSPQFELPTAIPWKSKSVFSALLQVYPQAAILASLHDVNSWKHVLILAKQHNLSRMLLNILRGIFGQIHNCFTRLHSPRIIKVFLRSVSPRSPPHIALQP